MGKPLAVDWHEVRTLALAIGVREAARRMGISENTVKRRCLREGWLAARHAAEASLDPAKRKEATNAALAMAHGLSVEAVPNVPTALDTLSRMPQTVLTLKEKRAFLRSVVATPVGEVDESNILAQRVRRKSTINKLGCEETETEVWLPDKLRALELDAKLAGELSDRPERGPLVSLSFAAGSAAHEQVLDQVKLIEPTE